MVILLNNLILNFNIINIKLYNLGPGGNVQGKTMYEVGDPCSNCNCSTKYKYLCAADKNLKILINFSSILQISFY